MAFLDHLFIETPDRIKNLDPEIIARIENALNIIDGPSPMFKTCGDFLDCYADTYNPQKTLQTLIVNPYSVFFALEARGRVIATIALEKDKVVFIAFLDDGGSATRVFYY